MSILTWIILGLVAGSLANLIDPARSRGGIFGSIILGILGAVVGGFLANMIIGTPVTGFNFTSVIISVVGALIVLAIGRAFRGRGI